MQKGKYGANKGVLHGNQRTCDNLSSVENTHRQRDKKGGKDESDSKTVNRAVNRSEIHRGAYQVTENPGPVHTKNQ